MRTIIILVTLAGVILSVSGCAKKEPSPAPAAAETAAAETAAVETVAAEPESAPVVMEAAAEEPAGEEPAIEEPAVDEPKLPTGPIGQKAAALDGLVYIKGGPVTFEAGKVYVVEFWATWCGPCRVTIPHLTEMQEKYKDKGVTFIGISTDRGADNVLDNEDLKTARAFVLEQGEKMNYTVAWDGAGKADKNYMKAFNQQGIPAAFIVDGKGNIAWVGHPMDRMDEVLERVVAGNFDPVAYAKEKAQREATEREVVRLYQKYMNDLVMGATIEQSRPIAEKILASGHTMAANALAWEIVSLPNIDDANRDLETALKAAEKANADTEGKDPMVLDTYARVLFAMGKTDQAVAVQQKAVELTADQERIQAELKLRLEEYQKQQKQTAEPTVPAE